MLIVGLRFFKKTAGVDLSFNPLCDTRFKFYDSHLMEAVKLEEPAVQEFFRLLAVCHTVMAEEKTEGKGTTSAPTTAGKTIRNYADQCL